MDPGDLPLIMFPILVDGQAELGRKLKLKALRADWKVSRTSLKRLGESTGNHDFPRGNTCCLLFYLCFVLQMFPQTKFNDIDKSVVPDSRSDLLAGTFHAN